MGSDLRINLDASTLEKILLTNGEVTPEVRQSIVEAFCKRFLKGAVTKEAMEKAGEIILSQKQEIIDKVVGSVRSMGMTATKYAETQRMAIRSIVEQCLKKVVESEVEYLIGAEHFSGLVTDIVNNKVDSVLRDMVLRRIEGRVGDLEIKFKE